MGQINKMNKIIEFRMLHPEAKIPQYATDGSAGIDLHAVGSHDVHAGFKRLIPTGIAVGIQDKNIVGLLTGRSGLALNNGIRLGNSVGVIDSDYHKEIGVILHNDSHTTFRVNPGDRIAQLLFVPVFKIDMMLVNEFTEETLRGGFGSTGIK